MRRALSSQTLGPRELVSFRDLSRFHLERIEYQDGALMITQKQNTTVRMAEQVWKTITLGTGLKTADDFRKAIKEAGMKLGDWANGILGQPAFTAANVETEVDLVNVSAGELGFPHGAARRDIIAKALELGLQLCPAEVGPQLRLQYPDQPRGEWLIIAMQPITDSDGDPSVFDVGLDSGGRWLDGVYGYPGRVWGGGSRFVFVRPRRLVDE
jgi:hypothetical protein